MTEVKIKLDGGIMPKRATAGAAAFDLYVPEDVTLESGRQIVNLKFSIELPHGYAATIQPRSGFSAKGIECLLKDIFKSETEKEPVRVNADVVRGLIDEDYRGNVGVILNVKETARGCYEYILPKGTRIAQMQIVEVPEVELIETEELSETDRGAGGFGSTGGK